MAVGVEKQLGKTHRQGLLVPAVILAILVLVVSQLLDSKSPVVTWLIIALAILSVAFYSTVRKYRLVKRMSSCQLVVIQKLEQTLNAIADTHWEWDLSADAYDYHGSLATVLGYPNKVGDTAFWKDVIHPVDRPMHKYRLLRHLENESIPFYSEYRLKSHDGSYSWFAARGQVVQRDIDGQPSLMVGGLENIQQRKDLEKNLIHAHKMEAIGQLTGGIAHDFNNILASVLGYTELAQEARNPIKIASYLDQIHQGGMRARNIVRQLLDFSRGARSETEIVNLEDELYNAIMMLRSTLPRSIEITETYPSISCFTRLDPDQFQRVLLNICINARDAMDGNGTLTICLDTVTISNKHCTSCQKEINGKYHRITVSDNGEGISPDNLVDLFTPFYTTKEIGKGSGLGLSVVHGITHEFNGHLVIESSSGHGTSLSLFLPVLSGQMTKSISHKTQFMTGKMNFHILVVDDESSIASLISEVLENQGATVEMRTSAQQALKRLHQPDGHHQGEKFDLVISDQIMPSMTGLELATQLMALDPELPIVLCSGSEIAVGDCPTNVVKVLQKPINNHYLLDSVRDVFAQY